MNFSAEADDHSFDFPLIAGDSEAALEDHHARAKDDYESWKYDFLVWLRVEGKKPDRLEGYSSAVVRATSYKTDQVMRWLWMQRGYTTELTPDDADELMKTLGRQSDYSDSNLKNFVKTIKRIFSYYNYEKGRDIEWDCKYAISEPRVTNRDYFKKSEFRPLYEAALNHGAVKHYNNCSPEERERLKSHLAQRFEKPKDEITPHDFERANTFKIPSLISTALDCGLRPIEIKRASVEWVNPSDETLVISRDDSSKNEDNWECVLSSNTVRALNKWLNERASYEKYAHTDALWLNKQGNRYTSKPLNYLLDQLIEEAGIEPAGRDLTWYSIRHGVATVWADEEKIQHAQEQLRHKKVETTLGYSHSGAESRHRTKNSKW